MILTDRVTRIIKLIAMTSTGNKSLIILPESLYLVATQNIYSWILVSYILTYVITFVVVRWFCLSRKYLLDDYVL